MSRHASRISPLPAAERDCELLTRSLDIKGLRLTKTTDVLVIEGQVPCYRTKKLAGVAAARLLGALCVVNQLRVVPQSHRCDAEIVKAVQAALRSGPGLANAGIVVSVCDGIVTLQGSLSSPAIRCEAELAIWAVGGVVDVENQLRVERLPARNHHAADHASSSGCGR